MLSSFITYNFANLFAPPRERDAEASARFLDAGHLANLAAVRQTIQGLPTFTAEALEAAVRRLPEAAGGKLIDYAQPVRVAL